MMFRLRLGWSAEQASKDNEATLSLYFQNYRERGCERRFVYVIKHPLETLRVVITIFRSPSLSVEPSITADGALIREALTPHSLPGRIAGFTTGVLKLPNAPRQYMLGPAKQTLRRKVRAAQKLGVSWAEVVHPWERQELLELASQYERNIRT
jgi:hypothetical protein